MAVWAVVSTGIARSMGTSYVALINIKPRPREKGGQGTRRPFKFLASKSSKIRALTPEIFFTGGDVSLGPLCPKQVLEALQYSSTSARL